MSLTPANEYSSPFLAWLSPREQIRLLSRECRQLDSVLAETQRAILLRERLIKAARHRLDQSVLSRH